jgi:hypothetical protein
MVGRPKKVNNLNEDANVVKKRMYQRKYQLEVKAGLSQLLKDERTCNKDLKEANKKIEKLNLNVKKLIKFVEDCDEQLGKHMISKLNKKIINI